jgi:hypothetical protein
MLCALMGFTWPDKSSKFQGILGDLVQKNDTTSVPQHQKEHQEQQQP